MGLKDDIFNALITNVQPDETVENFSMTNKGIDKVEILSENLTKAIAKYVENLTFRIISATSETILPPGSVITAAGGPNTNPIKISTNISKDNPKGLTDQANSMISVVKVDPTDNKKQSGVSIA